jgi:hypothetical protein
VIGAATLLALACQARCPAGEPTEPELPPGVIPVPMPPGMADHMRHARYVQSWSHAWLYFSSSVLLSPYRETTLLSLPPGEGLITGLASTPCGDVLAYALTRENDSRLMLTSVDEGEGLRPRVVHQARNLGGDQWLHEPMSLSPNKGWLLVTASAGRREMLTRGSAVDCEQQGRFSERPGSLWLVDCTAQDAPRRLSEDCRLLSCAWAPSGGKAVCELQAYADGEVSVVLFDLQSGRQKVLASGKAHASWSTDGRQVRLLRAHNGRSQTLIYDLKSQAFHAEDGASLPYELADDLVWSSDGAIVAWAERRGSDSLIQIATATSLVRTASAAAGVARLLGWSCGGELLAYVDVEGGLQFCSGTRSDAELRRIKAVRPARPQLSASEREHPEGLGLETTYSPIGIDSPERVMAAWRRGAAGPCLVYVDFHPEGRQSMSALTFKCLTLRDLGIDPSRDLRRQVIMDVCDSHLITISVAIRLYADEHEGRCPPHATGPELAEDLDPYLGGRAARHMGSAYAPDEFRMRLLHPGGTIDEFRRMAKEQGVSAIPLLELRGDDGYMFHWYTDGSVRAITPEGQTETVSSWD